MRHKNPIANAYTMNFCPNKIARYKLDACKAVQLRATLAIWIFFIWCHILHPWQLAIKEKFIPGTSKLTDPYCWKSTMKTLFQLIVGFPALARGISLTIYLLYQAFKSIQPSLTCLLSESLEMHLPVDSI
jgi:hypothetical protein